MSGNTNFSVLVKGVEERSHPASAAASFPSSLQKILLIPVILVSSNETKCSSSASEHRNATLCCFVWISNAVVHLVLLFNFVFQPLLLKAHSGYCPAWPRR